MTLSAKAMERINGMTKGQVLKAIQDIEDGLGNPAALEALNARLLKFAPPAPTPFPRQTELTEAYAQIKIWSDTAKKLIKEARDGNHTFVNSDSVTVKPGRARKANIEHKGSLVAIVIDGKSYGSFSAVAVAFPDIQPHLNRAISRNWREHVLAA